MAYNDAILNEADRAKVKALGEQWQAAKAAGDTAGMDAAHQGAENIRSQYGYSGGAAGNEDHQTGENTRLYAGASQSDYINGVYDAQLEAQKQALESAYNQKEAEYSAAEAKIPAQYDAQRNALSAQNEIEKANFNEQAAASGLNVGAGSQARLSQSNAYQQGMTALGKAQADAASNLQLERTKAKTAYQDAIQQAIKDNDGKRAQALYEEAQRIDDNLVSNALNQANLDATRSSTNYAKMMETAQTLAHYGDFSGYLALGYSQDQVDAMRKVWEAQNAELVAKMNGTYVPSVGYSGRASGGASGGSSYSYDESGNGGSGKVHHSVTHNDIDYTNPESVQNAVTASDTIRAMIKRGDSISDVNAAITKASQGGLISDDAARRLRYTNNSRA